MNVNHDERTWRWLRRAEPLVTRDVLEQAIDGVNDLQPASKAFLKARWVGMVMYWHERSVRARRWYFLFRRVVIIGGVLLPVLSALDLSGLADTWGFPVPLAMAVVAAVVAGCTAWEGVANYGEVWREKRRAAELLKCEGWQFLQLAGKYRELEVVANEEKYKSAFPLFAAESEAMIAREIGEYLGVFGESLALVQAQSREVAKKIAAEIAEEWQKAHPNPSP